MTLQVSRVPLGALPHLPGALRAAPGHPLQQLGPRQHGHVVHAEVEEVRLPPPARPQGRQRHPQDLHVPPLTQVQPTQVQARPPRRFHSRQVQSLSSIGKGDPRLRELRKHKQSYILFIRYVPWHSARIELCKAAVKDNSVTGERFEIRMK